MRPFAYARAENVSEAAELLADATPLAGGTDLLGLMKDRITSPARLVDISGLRELRGWSRDGTGLRIGALTSLRELEVDEEFARALPIVPQALAVAATPQLRTMGTVGGNLLQRNRCWYFRDEAFPCWLKGGERCFAAEGDNRYHAILGAAECVMASPSDLAPALIAYDATVELRSSTGSREIPLADLYVRPHDGDRREHAIAPGELLTAVAVPNAALSRRGAYLKAMDRKAWSFALVSVAVAARLDHGRAGDVRVVLGSAAPIPWRSREAEQAVEGSALDERACANAADAALAEARPLSENAYKVPLARELIRRALRSLA
jgi:xanthine dehydrogenase YagS FAD-binding subunit